MKKIIKIALLLVLGGGCFAGAYRLAYKAPAPSKEGVSAKDAEKSELERGLKLAGVSAEKAGELQPGEWALQMLVKELQAKRAEQDERDKALDERERRLKMSQEQLAKQAQELEAMTVQLIAPLNSIKDATAQLQAARIAVGQDELVQLKHLALLYEKMEPAAGGKAIESMCINRQEDDAVKILNFMTERAAAKLLGEIPDKSIIARLSDRMKRLKVEG